MQLMQNHKLSNEMQGILLMLKACFWFAIMASIIRHVSQTMPPFEMVFFRNVFSVVCILPWAWKFGFKNIRTKRIKLYLMRTISGVAGMTMLFYSISIIPLTQTIALTFTVPIFTTILAIFFLNERVGWHRWAAIIVGFIGVLIIVRPGAEAFHYGSLLVIATTCCWSVSNILVKKLTDTDDSKTIVFLMMLFMTPFSLPLALTVWQAPTLIEICWLFALGWISNQAQFAMTSAYSKTDINVVLPFDFSRLVFISIIAYIFFGEIIDIYTAIGAFIIFASSVYVARVERRRRKKILIDNASDVA